MVTINQPKNTKTISSILGIVLFSLLIDLCLGLGFDVHLEKRDPRLFVRMLVPEI